MKTKLLCLVLSTMIFSAAHSQGFHLGVKGGANINKLTGQSFSDEFSFGYHLGAFAQFGLGKKLYVQPELVFNQIKQDTSSNFSDIYKNVLSSTHSDVKLNYMSIPVLVGYKFSNMLSVQAGPQFAILKEQNVSLLQSGKDAFKKGDLSMLAGVQFKFSSLRIYGRYAIGLTNLNDIDDKDKWRSQSFQVGVGLAIL